MFNFRDTNSTYLHYRTIALLNEIEPYYILTVVAVGLLGNSISFGIFLSSRSKKKESNYILASLGLVDNIFLITLTLVNLRHIGIDPFNHYKYVCKLTVYLTFVCGFLSVWLVTLFSIERFIAVMFPLHRFSICNRKRNQLSIFVLVLFALIFYSFYFVTTGIEADIEHPSVTQCIAYEKWVETVKTMNFVDIMLTIVMPFIIIFIINISISLKLTRFSFLERFKTNVTSPTTRATSKSPSHSHHHHHRHNQRLSSWSSIRNYGLCNGSAATARSSVSSTEERINIVKGDEPKENNNNNNSNKKQSLISSALAINTSSTPLPHQVLLMAACSTYRRKRFKSYSRTTRMLIIISATYIMLNALMAYLKLRHLFEPYFISDDQHHLEERKRLNNELLERASCYLYYLNFSINFFLYVLNKSTFTDILFDLFKRRSNATSTAATKV